MMIYEADEAIVVGGGVVMVMDHRHWVAAGRWTETVKNRLPGRTKLLSAGP